MSLLMLEIIDKGIDEELETEVEEVNGPRLKDFHLPFFFDMTGLSRPEADDGDGDNDL